MSKLIDVYKSNFNAGVWTSKTMARVELDGYPYSLSECENFVPFPQGGIEKRPPTKFITEVKNSAGKVRLKEMPFTLGIQYVMEFGAGYIRFFKDEAYIESGGVPYEVVTPYLDEELDDLCFAQIANKVYITHLNHKPKILTRNASDDWVLEDIEFFDGAFLEINKDPDVKLDVSGTSGNITIFVSGSTIAPFTSGDVGRMVRIMQTESNKDYWGCAVITSVTNGQTVRATVQIGHEFKNTTASQHWRMGAWSDELGYPALCCFHEQRLVLAKTKSYPQDLWLSCSREFHVFSPTKIKGTTGHSLTDDSAIAYRITTSQAGSIQWLVSGNVLQIGFDSKEFCMQASSLNEALTYSNAKCEVSSEKGSLPIAPIHLDHNTLYVHRTGNKIYNLKYTIDTQRHDSSDVNVFAESILRDEGGVANGSSFAYAQYPNEIAYIVCKSGAIAGLTFKAEQGTISWSMQRLGGVDAKVLSVAPCYNKTESYDQIYMLVQRKINGELKQYIEVQQNYFYPKEVQDKEYNPFSDCYVSVDNPMNITAITSEIRPVITTELPHGLVDTNIVRILGVEQMPNLNHKMFEIEIVSSTEFRLKQDVDMTNVPPYEYSGVCYVMTNYVSGLEYLEGQEVSILLDGGTIPNQVVENGELYLPMLAGVIHVGLPYNAKIKLPPLELPNGLETFFLRKKRAVRIGIMLLNTLGLQLGDRGMYERLTFHNTTDTMGNAPDLYTGFKLVAPSINSEEVLQYEVLSSENMPCTILSLALRVTIS